MASVPCAVCRGQRKKCVEGCIFAPHFPKGREKDYADVNDAFGMASLKKKLEKINDVETQSVVVNSYVWEGNMWAKDHIGGPLAEHERATKELTEIRKRLQDMNQAEPSGSNQEEPSGSNQAGTHEEEAAEDDSEQKDVGTFATVAAERGDDF